MRASSQPAWRDFASAFDGIARHRRRYEVFRDFVTLSALTLHNAVRKDHGLEAEYLQIVTKYKMGEVDQFCRMFASLVILLDGEPADVLGQLYMSLGLGDTEAGQFFTPQPVSDLMAGILYGDELQKLKEPFVTACDPACGAGGLILAFTKVIISHGHNPSETMWVQCQDIDRLPALMCYLQLALWNVPAMVVVGDTLARESREVFYTPQHYLGFWDVKLRRRQECAEAAQAGGEGAEPKQALVEDSAQKEARVGEASETPIDVLAAHVVTQFDFGF